MIVGDKEDKINSVNMDELSEEDIDRIIQMGWEDRTPFEAITFNYGISKDQIVDLMKKELNPKNYLKWKKRVNNTSIQKNYKKRDEEIIHKVVRFRSKMQRDISGNKISKRKEKRYDENRGYEKIL